MLGRKKPQVTNLESAHLMTFEDFSGMQLSDYRESVVKTIQDGDTLYPSIITDIHSLGLRLS